LAAIIEGMFQYTKGIPIFMNWDTEQIQNKDMERISVLCFRASYNDK